ncbi:MAG: hypothetical protein ACI9MR_004279 [Myxococcota bacterium]|jgi:hypothetical protein
MPSSASGSAAPSPIARWFPWILVAVVAGVVVWQHTRLGTLTDQVASLSASTADVTPATTKKPSDLKTRVTMESLGDVERRMGIMEQRLKGIDGRLRRAEKRGGHKGALKADPTAAMALVLGSGDDATPDEVHALRQDVDALLTGEGMNAPEAKVVIEKMLEQRDQKRRNRWIKMGDEAAKVWAEEVSTSLDLDDETSADLSGILNTRRETRRAMYQKVRDDEMTYVEARKEMDAVRAAAADEIKTLLGEEKYTLFEQKEEERRSQRRRGL